MVTVLESRHFLPADKMPLQSLNTSAGTAYATMAGTNSGGLVVEEQGAALWYLTAPFLKTAIGLAAAMDGIAAAVVLPLWKHIYEALKSGSLRSDASNLALLRIEHKWLQHDDAEPIPTAPLFPIVDQTYKVYRVLGPNTSASRFAGWYFSHEDAHRTTQTPAPKWQCSNPNPHENADPDSGYCRFCPFKIVV